MANLPNAKLLYFPNDYINGQNTGNHYLPIENVTVYSGDYALWAECTCPTQPEDCRQIIITCDADQAVMNTVEHFYNSGQKKTVACYMGLDDVDTQHTDIMRLIQYGEYRSLNNKVQKNAIYYPMVFGNERLIPF